jgi:hypothetical protein
MAETPTDGESTASVRFHYIKSNFFRVVHMDGCIGGVTPPGFIHGAVYSERPAIPQLTEHEVRVDPANHADTLGPGKVIEGRAGFVRELEVDLIISRNQAVAFRDWLDAKIKELDDLRAHTPVGNPE